MIICNGKECNIECPVSNVCFTMELKRNGMSDKEILDFLEDSNSNN